MRLYGRFLLTLLIGIFCAILGMRYSRTVLRSLTSAISQTPPPSSFLHSSSMASQKTVVVVGSGLAGLSAAYEALQAGASVRLLDRAPKPGGNSIKASSGINGAGTSYQKAAGVAEDSLFYEDTVKSAGKRFSTTADLVDRKGLVERLTSGSAGAVEWLASEFEIDMSVVATLGGHSVARTHRGAKGTPGFSIVSALLKKLGEHPAFELTSGAEVTALALAEDGSRSVRGVRYTHEGAAHELAAGAVVFAAGGFAGDAGGLLAQHRPDLAGLPSTNDDRPAPHHLLEAAGAAFVDMDSVQVHPTGFVDPKESTARYKILAAEALRGEGGILLGPGGARFVNELDTRDKVSDAIMALPTVAGEAPARQWDITLLMDPGACDAAGAHLGFYMWKGLMEKKRVRDLAPAVVEAVDAYATAVAAGKDTAFGRRSFGHWRLPAGEANRDQEVCVGRVTPITHFTMGGAAFTEAGRVLRADKTPIDGIWAAGEITGGLHGDNRLGGSSLLECVVFGRIAGAEAAKSVV